MWIDAWSQPGSTTAGLNYYRANHRNPPFNDRHPASTIPSSWSAKEVTQGAASTIIKTPTFVIWGMKDTAILSGHLSGLDKWVPNLSVKLYPDDDHWVMLEKATSVAQDIRRFIDDKNFPKESVYRAEHQVNRLRSIVRPRPESSCRVRLRAKSNFARSRHSPPAGHFRSEPSRGPTPAG